MERRRWYFVVALVVLAGAGGFALGRSSDGGGEAEPAHRPGRHAPGAERGQAAVPAQPHDWTSGLEAELERERARVDELEREFLGAPLQWPATVPDAARPAVFEANIRRAFAACGVDVENVAFDCSEAPCYVTFVRPQVMFTSDDAWNVSLRNCDPMNALYEDGWSISTFRVECPDGTEEGATMLSVQPIDDPDWLGSEEDKEFMANWLKRFDARRKAIADSWRCDPA